MSNSDTDNLSPKFRWEDITIAGGKVSGITTKVSWERLPGANANELRREAKFLRDRAVRRDDATAAHDIQQAEMYEHDAEELERQQGLLPESDVLACRPPVNDSAFDAVKTSPGEKVQSGSQAGAISDDGGDGDPIEDALTGQKLALYRYLKPRRRRTPFDILAKLKCWRVDQPTDDAIVKALKRLRDILNKIPNCSISLVIEGNNRRTRLDK